MTSWLFSCMRNEAPYALEWVAYHRMIGFDRVVICTNDCSDGTEQLLDALAELGWLDWIRNPTPRGVSPQIHAASRVGETPPWQDGDWVMWLDTDEFLNVHTGQKRVGDLLGQLGTSNGYAVHWRLFGDSFLNHWQDLPVVERFTNAARPRLDLHEPVKTLFQWSDSVEGLHSHRPVLRPSFRERNMRWLHGPGIEVPEVFYYHRYNKDSSPALRLPWVTGQYAWAQINHYAVRTRAEYRSKAARGSGIFDHRHNDEYWTLYNRNERTDESIQTIMPELRSKIREALDRPRVADARAAAIEAFREALKTQS